MTQFVSPTPVATSLDIGTGAFADDAEFGDFLAPVLAGARARGVADAYVLMGLAVVLLDRWGRVLHASESAERALRPLVTLADGHMIGMDAGINAALASVLAFALGNERGLPNVRLSDSDDRQRLKIEAVRVPRDNDAVQLLAAVLIITDVPEV